MNELLPIFIEESDLLKKPHVSISLFDLARKVREGRGCKQNTASTIIWCKQQLEYNDVLSFNFNSQQVSISLLNDLCVSAIIFGNNMVYKQLLFDIVEGYIKAFLKIPGHHPITNQGNPAFTLRVVLRQNSTRTDWYLDAHFMNKTFRSMKAVEAFIKSV
jgi:hypothetical protein